MFWLSRHFTLRLKTLRGSLRRFHSQESFIVMLSAPTRQPALGICLLTLNEWREDLRQRSLIFAPPALGSFADGEHILLLAFSSSRQLLGVLSAVRQHSVIWIAEIESLVSRRGVGTSLVCALATLDGYCEMQAVSEPSALGFYTIGLGMTMLDAAEDDLPWLTWSRGDAKKVAALFRDSRIPLLCDVSLEDCHLDLTLVSPQSKTSHPR